MKRLTGSLLALMVVAASVLAAQPAPPAKAPAKRQAAKAATAKPAANAVAEIDRRTPPLPPFHPQEPVRIKLDNGMVIFLQEDHELPFIDGTARIRGGSREVPEEKAGLTRIFGESWRTGGTKDKTGDQLDDFLEARAAVVETGGGLDSATISFSSLKADFQEVFPIFVDLLEAPEFRQDKVDLAKQQVTTQISRRNEEPSSIASREARKLGYGKGSPYARQSEYWTVASVTRQDLMDFHKRFTHPNNIILGLVGDFDAKQMEALLRKQFGPWEKGAAVEPLKTEFLAPKPGVNLIEKEDVNQSNIEMVALGIRRDNPDFYAVTALNEVLSGGFSSRLFYNIRSKKGLAYSVGGGIGTNFDYPGLFNIGMGTKSESTGKAIDALYEEIDNLAKRPVAEEELKRAKANILNSFIFNFDSREKVLREKMLYEFYGYPLDTLEHFRQGIEKVTLDEVHAAVKKYVDRNRFAILVVGKAADFDRPLESFGPVTKIDVTIPTEPPAKK